MKKWLVLSVFMAALPLTMMAQDDDLYFNPKQEAKKAAEEAAKKKAAEEAAKKKADANAKTAERSDTVIAPEQPSPETFSSENDSDDVSTIIIYK